MKILFVCSGNVGRSQIAEAYYNKFSLGNNSISAGVDSSTPNKYPKLSQLVIDIMQEDGIDVSKKRVKYITQKMIKEADRVIVMCKREICPKFLQDSKKVIYWEVSDPYKASINNFRIIRGQIKEKVLELLK